MDIRTKLKISNALLCIVSGNDLIHNRASLSEDERRSIRSAMECTLADLDNMGVPFSVQNAALYAGEDNKQKRYCSSFVSEIMEKYADKLSDEARSSWKAVCEKHQGQLIMAMS